MFTEETVERALARLQIDDPMRESVLSRIFRSGRSVMIYRYPDGFPGGRGGQFAPSPGGDVPNALPAKVSSVPSVDTKTSSRAKGDPESSGASPARMTRFAKMIAWADDLSLMDEAIARKRERRDAAVSGMSAEQAAEVKRRDEAFRARFGVMTSDAADRDRIVRASRAAAKVLGHPERGMSSKSTPTDERLTRSLWRRQDIDADHQQRRDNRTGIRNRLQEALSVVAGREFGDTVWGPHQETWDAIHAEHDQAVGDAKGNKTAIKVADYLRDRKIAELAAVVNPQFQNGVNPATGDPNGYPIPILPDGSLNNWWSKQDPWYKDGYRADERMRAQIISEIYPDGIPTPVDEWEIENIDEVIRLNLADMWIVNGPRDARKKVAKVSMRVNPEHVIDTDVPNDMAGRAHQVAKVAAAVVRQQSKNAAEDDKPLVGAYHDAIDAQLREIPPDGFTEDAIRSAIKRARAATDRGFADNPHALDVVKRAHMSMSDTLDQASTIVRKRARGVVDAPDRRVGGAATPRELRTVIPSANLVDGADAAKEFVDATAKRLGKDISRGGAPTASATANYGGVAASRGGKGHRSLKGRPWRTRDDVSPSETVPKAGQGGAIGGPRGGSEIVAREVAALLRFEERLDKARSRRSQLMRAPESERDERWRKQVDAQARVIDGAEASRKRRLDKIARQPDTQRQAVGEAVSRLLADVNRAESTKLPRATAFTPQRASEILDMLRRFEPEAAMTKAEVQAAIRSLKRKRDKMEPGPARSAVQAEINELAARIRKR